MSRRKPHRSERQGDSSSESASQPATGRGIQPRMLPPLIGLGLLIVMGCILLFRPGSREEKAAGLRVRQVEQTAEFSYLELEDDQGQTMWIAAPRSDVQAGDRVHYESAEPATNFSAPSLKRTFDRILLVPRLFKVDASGEKVALGSKPLSGETSPHGHGMDGRGMDRHGMANNGMQGHGTSGHGISGHGGMTGHGSAAGLDVPIPPLERVEGGQSLAEISAAGQQFGGREVKLRGVIVSALPKTRASFDAPPTNWYRLRDRADAKEALVFTSDETLQRGDVVVVSGKLALDRDFGGGMRYKMIIEGARVVREKNAEVPLEKKSTETPRTLEKSK